MYREKIEKLMPEFVETLPEGRSHVQVSSVLKVNIERKVFQLKEVL